MLKRILFLAMIAFAISAQAQVTSSSLTGNVKKQGGEALVGATVKATHEPTGTTFTTQTRGDGLYNIVNMIPGGPYKIEVTFVGFSPFTQSNITLPLGETTRIDAEVAATGGTLTEVVVSATGTTRRKTG